MKINIMHYDRYRIYMDINFFAIDESQNNFSYYIGDQFYEDSLDNVETIYCDHCLIYINEK